MRQIKQTRWILWTCDLDGCEEQIATHRELDDDYEMPPGHWHVIKPPKMWKGPMLAFCSKGHFDQFVHGYVTPLLTGGDA